MLTMLQIDHDITRDVLACTILKKSMLKTSSPPPIVTSLGILRTLSTTIGSKMTHTPRDVLASTIFGEEHVQGIVATANRLVTGIVRTISTTVGSKLTITHQGTCLPAPVIHPRGATCNIDDVDDGGHIHPGRALVQENPALANRRGRPGGGSNTHNGGTRTNAVNLLPNEPRPTECYGGRGGANRNVRSCDLHKPNKVRH